MSEKLKQILTLVDEFAKEKIEKEKIWKPGEDWLSYSGPVFSREEYMSAVEVLLGGWLIFGKNAREFELKFSHELGKKFGVLTNSGSSANLLMLAALTSRDKYVKEVLNIKKGDKIITPIVCFPTTLNPILQNGFEPVFVDVDLPSLNPNLDEVEKLLESDKDIRRIMFAHVLGNPPDMERLMHLVDKYNLVFLEDTCDALGSTYDGKKLGSFGTMSSCSFFPAHHMTTGEGGFIATDSGKLRKLLASFRDWGRACYCNTAKPGNVTRGTACGNRFGNLLPVAEEALYDHRYVFDEIGYNLKPLELQAAMGLQQLDKLNLLDEARRKNWSRLKKIFAPYHSYFHLPEATEKSDPCWFAFLLTVKADAPFDKGDIIEHLEAAKIQTRSYFAGNILYHPGYNHLATIQGDMKKKYPIAHKVTTSSFFLGTFAGITEEKLDYIEKIVNDFMDKYR